MKTILWFLISLFDNNWGYTTPLQKRFNVGDKCKISQHKSKENTFEVGEEVTIVENGRHDYLVKNRNGKMIIVYQFELT